MRPLVLALCALGLTAACDSKPTAAPADAEPAAPATAEPAAEAATEDPADDRMAAARADKERKLARWTPQMRDDIAALRATAWSDLATGMDAILKSAHREPGNAGRDGSRRPAETLAFFGLTPSMHVFEVGQGAGWYTELLAPLLAKQGKLYLGGYDANSNDARIQNAAERTQLFLDGAANLYDDVGLVNQTVDDPSMGAPDSMDMVLVIRMMHNVHRFELWDAWMPAAHTALKPGGVLAVVQHRAADDANPDETAPKGYMPEPWL
ncbi:MAG: methyltransferase domain-containing protein, partial [Myxococcota bacterium]